MSHYEHILIAYKKSTYERYHEDEDASLRELIEREHVSVRSLSDSHERHTRSLAHVISVVEERGLDYDSLYRGDVSSADGYDLVISVGGDGTVLDLSHKLDERPLLGINSDPEASIGYFCAGNATDFGELLDRTLEEKWEPIELMRFGITMNGVSHGYPILNDILVCHANPAAMSSYIVRVGEAEDEAQKSSGVWIATPAGSTAAIRSAGGYVLPLNSQKIEYLVREPSPPHVGAYRHLKGIREPGDPFEIVSKMPEGRVYLDGPHIGYRFTVGDVLGIDGDVPPLRIYGLDEKLRE